MCIFGYCGCFIWSCWSCIMKTWNILSIHVLQATSLEEVCWRMWCLVRACRQFKPNMVWERQKWNCKCGCLLLMSCLRAYDQKFGGSSCAEHFVRCFRHSSGVTVLSMTCLDRYWKIISFMCVYPMWELGYISYTSYHFYFALKIYDKYHMRPDKYQFCSHIICVCCMCVYMCHIVIYVCHLHIEEK